MNQRLNRAIIWVPRDYCLQPQASESKARLQSPQVLQGSGKYVAENNDVWPQFPPSKAEGKLPGQGYVFQTGSFTALISPQDACHLDTWAVMSQEVA